MFICETHLKQSIKKKIGRAIGKPYVADDYLVFAQSLLFEKPDAVVLDVGANIGMTMVPLAKAFPKATFFA